MSQFLHLGDFIKIQVKVVNKAKRGRYVQPKIFKVT